MFDALAAEPDTDPWAHIGQAAVLLLDERRTVHTEETARLAVDLDSGLSMGHYQLGLVHGWYRDYARAVIAFDMVINIEPRFAYTHYYAGLSAYQIKRTDKVAVRL